MDVRRTVERFEVGTGLLTMTRVKHKLLTTKINSKAKHDSRDGVGDRATGLPAAELKVRNQVEERHFSLHQNARTGFGVEPASFTMVSDILHGGKAAQA
jgi:hypothetical protein